MAIITSVNENLYTVDVRLPEYSVRGAIIVGTTHAIVWDTLTHPSDMQEVNTIIGDKPYYVIYTHADWDHIWGTAGLVKPPLAIIGHKLCRDRFDDTEDVSKTLDMMRVEQPDRWNAVELIPPTIMFSEQMTIDLGGLEIELHHLAGHTDDCIVGWLPDMGVLLGGDVMETPLPVVNNGDAVQSWLSKLKIWSDKDGLKQTIPSHGTSVGLNCLNSTITYLTNLLSDAPFPTPDTDDSFYVETHDKNIKLVRGA